MDSNSCRPCCSELNVFAESNFEQIRFELSFWILQKGWKILIGEKKNPDEEDIDDNDIDYEEDVDDDDVDSDEDDDDDHDCDQLEFTPLTELDYGTFLCWAENSVGRWELLPCNVIDNNALLSSKHSLSRSSPK